MPAEAIFPQEYFVYYKGKWCTAGGKDPLFGHVDGFQIGPKYMVSPSMMTSASIRVRHAPPKEHP